MLVQNILDVCIPIFVTCCSRRTGARSGWCCRWSCRCCCRSWWGSSRVLREWKRGNGGDKEQERAEEASHGALRWRLLAVIWPAG